MNNADPFTELENRRTQARLGGGQERIDRQHEKGKLTARERLDILLDEGSFEELGMFVRHQSRDFGLDSQRPFGDGVVTGYGTINGRLTYVFSQDFTVFGGSLGQAHASKIINVMRLAMQNGAPMIGLNDSGGARIQEGVVSLGGYADIFLQNTLASGVIPQISAILGPCAGGAVYSPAITDFVFMVDGVSNMYITGPDVIRAVTGEEISHEDLGGAVAHASASGVAHFRFEDEAGCMAFLRRLLTYLPQNNQERPPLSEPKDSPDRETPELFDVLSDDEKKSYEVREVISALADVGTFLEVQPDYAQNVVVGFAKLAGRTVGIFANQPKVYAAALNIDASDKGARFIRFCDAFNIPVVTLVDVPGFLPGVSQEHGGII
ncbi:MAG: acyl-CoA carboxylase subunit beta, partial [Rhodothermales bacterium]